MSNQLKKMGNNEPVLLIGAGPMALEYVKVLKSRRQNFLAVTRSAESAARFAEQIGQDVRAGGVTNLTDAEVRGRTAIVAVNPENLFKVSLETIEKGIAKILIEKPASFSRSELAMLVAACQSRATRAYVAYNRRFYSSVRALKDRLESDPILSIHFEFTEWSHRIEEIPMSDELRANWLLANSTHVIDLAFSLGGWPESLTCHTRGGLSWHPAGAIFAGAGITESGVVMSYHSNWLSPGRWSVEVMTRNTKFILRPLEKLQEQSKGTLEGKIVAIDDQPDMDFKPGLYRQTSAFLEGDNSDLPTLEEQLRSFEEIYAPILGRL